VSSSGRMPSKLTSCKLSSPTTRTTTSRNKPRTFTSTKPKLLPVQACTGLTGAPHRSDRCSLGSNTCRCFRPANLPRGTRGSRLCGEDRDRETENSKVCTMTRDTRFIQVRVTKVASLTSYLGYQVWCPALGVG
jgi:hypothetical protein